LPRSEAVSTNLLDPLQTVRFAPSTVDKKKLMLETLGQLPGGNAPAGELGLPGSEASTRSPYAPGKPARPGLERTEYVARHNMISYQYLNALLLGRVVDLTYFARIPAGVAPQQVVDILKINGMEPPHKLKQYLVSDLVAYGDARSDDLLSVVTWAGGNGTGGEEKEED
jgi:hypothetical protein